MRLLRAVFLQALDKSAAALRERYPTCNEPSPKPIPPGAPPSSKVHLAVLYRQLIRTYDRLLTASTRTEVLGLLRTCSEMNLMLGTRLVTDSSILHIYILDSLYFALLHRGLTESDELLEHVISSVKDGVYDWFFKWFQQAYNRNDDNLMSLPNEELRIMGTSIPGLPALYTEEAIQMVDEAVRKETDGTVGLIFTEKGRGLVALDNFMVGEFSLEDPADLIVVTTSNPSKGSSICWCCGSLISNLNDSLQYMCQTCHRPYCSPDCKEYDLSYHSHTSYCALFGQETFSKLIEVIGVESLKAGTWGTSHEATLIVLHLIALLSDRCSIPNVTTMTLWRCLPQFFLLHEGTPTNYEWYESSSEKTTDMMHVSLSMTTVISLFLGISCSPLLMPHMRPSILHSLLLKVLQNGFGEIRTLEESTKSNEESLIGIFHLNCYHALVNHSCSPNFRRSTICTPGGALLGCLECIRPTTPGDEILISYASECKVMGTPRDGRHYLDVMATHGLPLCTCAKCEHARQLARGSGTPSGT
ncbi:SET domain-containing protein [Giardia muris]|uniref:SET domain-containing protein n=1 Tax=Giardia muris TaxID=5742 RepID=A0A4Z1SZ97_GIAMU|nr:SET domain-containing protein [Giardia muris]|eukprot:TNJ30085.1 SET domain-containing protein [Giardia muris]